MARTLAQHQPSVSPVLRSSSSRPILAASPSCESSFHARQRQIPNKCGQCTRSVMLDVDVGRETTRMGRPHLANGPLGQRGHCLVRKQML